MATKKTTPETKPAAKKAAKPTKAKAVVAAARHPLAKLKALHGSKSDLVAKIAAPLVSAKDDLEAVKGRLVKASNKQLLHLASVVETVQQKFGTRDKLIATIGAATKQATDKDYLAKLASMSLPQLLDLATAAARRAKHA